MPHIGIGSQAGKLPGQPTGIAATQISGGTNASVSFTAPTYKGKSGTIANYTVTVSPGGATFSGATSPITVNGLSAGTAYNFNVVANTTLGNSTFTGASGASGSSFTPVNPNISVPTVYNTASTYTPNTYPFSFKVVSVGGGGHGGYNNQSGDGDINNHLARTIVYQGSGGGGRIDYVNTTQTINSGSITMTVGAAGSVGGSGGATSVVVNQNGATISTANGGDAGGAGIINTWGNANSTKSNFLQNAGAGGSGGSGGGSGLVGVRMNNDYGTNKGGTFYVLTNGGTAGTSGGSGGASGGTGNLGTGNWTAQGGSSTGNAGTNSNSEKPPGGGTDAPAYAGVSIGGTAYFSSTTGVGQGAQASGAGAVLLIPV